jgi:hypothetical protein
MSGAAASRDARLQDDDEERVVALVQRAGVRRNFVRMSVCFSLNHACVTSALALSTANLGPVLGNASNAVLYVFYTFSALLYAGPHVRRRGSKAALVDSTFAFCVYVGSFYVAEVWQDAAWVAAIAGAAVGGVAAGVLFTAQGVYFTLSARAYAQLSQADSDSSGQPAGSSGAGDSDDGDDGGSRRLGAPDPAMEEATARFASVFASIYLLSEISFKLVAWILPRYWSAGWSAVSLTYLATAVAAAAAMVTIWRLEAEGQAMHRSGSNVQLPSAGSEQKERASDGTGRASDEQQPHASVPSIAESGTAPVMVLEAEAAAAQSLPSSSATHRSSSAAAGANGDSFGSLRPMLLLLFERQMLLAMGMNLACTSTFAERLAQLNAAQANCSLVYCLAQRTGL